ncbi:hypothetical protein M0805_008966 [Coniferiporia weirii]|nr:hypothetical protein M0805_008966 [Coniferiporia weirii]
MARRPEPGRLGAPYVVQANLFEVRNFPKDVIMHYDVIQSDPPKENENEERKHPKRFHKIMHRLQNSAPEIFRNATAYDGAKNLFTLKENLFNGGSMTFTVNRSDRPTTGSGATRSFDKVALKKVGEIRPAELDEVLKGLAGGLPMSTTPLQALNVFVQQAAALKFPVHTKQKFFIEDGKAEASGGLEIWRGFFQSVRPSPGRLLVNVDMASGVMFGPGPLINFVLTFFNIRNARVLTELSEGTELWSRMKMVLSGVQVTQRPDDRLRTIKSLVLNAGSYEFNTKEGNVITVRDYFERRYPNSKFQFPGMPGIFTTKKEVIPFEFCVIKEGQLFKKRASPELMARMLAFSKKKPAERLARVSKRLQIENSPFVVQAGLHISSTPMTVQGRILDPPAMSYGGNAPPQKPKSGAWNMVNRQLKEPMPVKTWAVVCFSKVPDESVKRFMMSLMEAMSSAGIGINFTTPTSTCPDKNTPEGIGNDRPEIVQANPFRVQEELHAICKRMHDLFKAPPTIIVVILPQNAALIKKDVKQFGDILHGVVTQCVREDKIMSANNQYCNNLILKINAKLGGVNTIPSGPAFDWFSEGKTMIVGADVTHPGPGVLRPSVATLVSSVDRGAAKYVSSSTVQEPRLEIIEGIGGMLKYALHMFNDYRAYIARGSKPGVIPLWPEQIIFYRDGVSEGEIQQVAEEEIKQISELLEELHQRVGIRSKLTFIVVGKRHHVRFFPKDGGDRSGNAPAGLVVDKDIISPGIFDFYLQSHAGLLGTSRPSHYIVIKDENNFTSDKLQSFSFVLCHTYARATRSVSIPAPCYYADIVCARADYHFEPSLNYDDDLSSGGEFDLERWKRGFGSLHKNQLRNMYFM